MILQFAFKGSLFFYCILQHIKGPFRVERKLIRPTPLALLEILNLFIYYWPSIQASELKRH